MEVVWSGLHEPFVQMIDIIFCFHAYGTHNRKNQIYILCGENKTAKSHLLRCGLGENGLKRNISFLLKIL